MATDTYLTVPNILSFYRLFAAPVALWFVFTNDHRVFAILICISLLSDLFDGLLARLLRQETEFGARLDTVADAATFFVGVIGAFWFESEPITEHLIWPSMFLLSYAGSLVIPLIRFGKWPALHLYSFKLNGFVLGGFFFVLFAYGFVHWLFVAAMIYGTLASIEVILVELCLDRFRINQRGLYWVLKSRAQGWADQP